MSINNKLKQEDQAQMKFRYGNPQHEVNRKGIQLGQVQTWFISSK